jgi:hypothetical protein
MSTPTLSDATPPDVTPSDVTGHDVVVAYPSHADATSHAYASHVGIARRISALKHCEFAGAYEPGRVYDGRVYFVASETLVGATAHELGIHSADDLFGGVVPEPFVATKVITHPLPDGDARAPAGWSAAFAQGVRDVVLEGFAAFSFDDARRGGARLLRRGPVRVKRPLGIGGRGQLVVRALDELEDVLAAYREELERTGIVLEENLSEVRTYSVGQIEIGSLRATYYGTQRTTRDNGGNEVYGGSDLVVARGDFDALFGADPELPPDARTAIGCARTYDRVAHAAFTGFFASRRNYDVAHGRDAHGRLRCGVLEQSWRLGGASGPEIAAMETFVREPARAMVRTSSVEIYGNSPDPPSSATIYFRGVDAHVGRLTKYTVVEHAHAR